MNDYHLVRAMEMVHNRNIDFKGHGWWDSSYAWSSKTREVITALLEGKTPDVECNYCEEKLDFELKDDLLVIKNDKCSLPFGVPDKYSAELDISSGRIVFANDLRQFFELDGDFDVNSEIGKMNCFMHYADLGLGHGFVGNSCPDIYYNNDNHFTIAQSGIIDESYKIGWICTDLWWYSIADYETIAGRGYIEGNYDTIAEVEPGTYELTYFTGFNRDLYSTLRRKE